MTDPLNWLKNRYSVFCHAQVCQGRGMVFPVLTVKRLNGQLLGLRVKATDVDVDTIGV
jgi:hypothetical protein